MTKKKKDIHSLKIDDRREGLLKCLGRTGICSDFDVGKSKAYELGAKSLESMEAHGYISSKIVDFDGGKQQTKIYRLEEKGRKWLKTECGFTSFQRSNDKQLDHDLKLSKVYNSLDSKYQETWKTESQLIKEYKSEHGKAAYNMVDACIMIGDKQVGIEIIGRSYTEKVKEEKREIATEIGCKEVLWFNGF